MGPQSSGKSTIAKICSQCSWCEKNYLLTGEEYDFFYSGLLDFHRMDKGYFSDDSEIIYESEWLTIHFKGNTKETFIEKNKKTNQYTTKFDYVYSLRPTHKTTTRATISAFAGRKPTTSDFVPTTSSLDSSWQLRWTPQISTDLMDRFILDTNVKLPIG